jgi:hypothetical protein
MVLEDLDLGLLIAAETYISMTRVSIGVYIAGRATINKIGLNGVPGVTMEARDIALEINLGARFSLDIGKIVKNWDLDAGDGITTVGNGQIYKAADASYWKYTGKDPKQFDLSSTFNPASLTAAEKLEWESTKPIVTFEADVKPSFAMTTIDFSKSTWKRPGEDVNGDGVLNLGEDRGNGMLEVIEDLNKNGRLEHGEDKGNGLLDGAETLQGYAIETGNPYEPIVLTYDSTFLRIFGVLEMNMFDLVKISGVIDFRLSEKEGLTAFANVSVQIGPDSMGFKSQATGLLVINSGGVAMRMSLGLDIDLGVASLDAKFELNLNSFGKRIVYDVPEVFWDVVKFDTKDDLSTPQREDKQYAIEAYPPGKESVKDKWTGPYVALTGKGNMDLMGLLTMRGDFAVIAAFPKDDAGNTAFRFEIGVTADLELKPLARLNATGTLGLIVDSKGPGLYGSLEIGGAGKDSVILDGGGAFSIAGRFLLQINTTNTIQLARGRDAEGNVFDADNKPIMVELTPQSLRIAGKAEVKVGPISLMGAVDFLINDKGVQLAMQVVLDMSAFGKIQVKGAAAIGLDANNQPFFALYLNFSTEMNIAILKIKAEASLRINTSSLDYTTLQGDVIKANTIFDLELRGIIDLFLFKVDFYGRMSVVDSVFKLEFEGKLNFFNITTVEMAGYVDSLGNFEFKGKIEIDGQELLC